MIEAVREGLTSWRVGQLGRAHANKKPVTRNLIQVTGCRLQDENEKSHAAIALLAFATTSQLERIINGMRRGTLQHDNRYVIIGLDKLNAGNPLFS